jgi:CRISPR-associated protein Csm3
MSLKIKQYNFTIKLLSGLHIGAGGADMRIGGVDSPVIRNPRTARPFIPGSSIKGKVRSLLEYYKSENDPDIKLLFGTGAGAGTDKKDTDVKTDKTEAEVESAKPKITRLSFADADIILNEDERASFEIKAETAINRADGKAKGGSLRFIERVVSGQNFAASISMKIFDGDNDANMENTLLTGLKLLSLDALGGSGSRGYGRIEITFNDPALQERFSALSI